MGTLFAPNVPEECQAFAQAASPQALFNVYATRAAALGFEYASLVVAIPGEPVRMARLHNFPAHWEQYRQSLLQPIYEHVLRTQAPLILPSPALRLAYPDIQRLKAEAGIASGVSLAVHQVGVITVLSIASRQTWTLKPKHQDEVADCLKRCAPYVAQYLTPMQVPTLLPPDLLDAREHDVLRLAATGADIDRTAELMHLSRDTVKHYRKKAMAKLDASNIAQAATLAHLMQLYALPTTV